MSGLPATIDPIQLAERGAKLTGQLPLKGMTRLTGSEPDDGAKVDVDLDFRRAEGGNVYEMVGRLRTRWRTTCQRCLQPLELELEARPRLLLLRPGDRADLAGPEADTLVVDKPLSLAQLVEDELILALPMYPVHPEGQCPAAALDRMTPGKKNPFSVLKGLKKTDR
jgi:uncharacterized protein